MIIGKTLQGPLGESCPKAPTTGDPVSGQSACAAVTRVQILLQKAAAMTGDTDLEPRGTGGKVNMNTAFAVVSAARKLGAQVPILKQILNVIGQAPGFGTVLTNRSWFDTAWTALKYGSPETLREYVIDPIRAGAAEIDVALKPIVDVLQPGGGGGGQLVTPLKIIPGALVPTYPAGTVGVRDPVLNKFRLIAPPIK